MGVQIFHNMSETKNDEITNVRLFMYMSWANAQKFIERKTLKATNPLKTNDPFEFLPNTEKGNISEEKSMIERMGLVCFCFSRLVSSAALWGHYGDKHKGVCLVFDIPLCDIAKLGFSLVRVRYQENRCVRDITFCEMFVKDKSWEFEQEYRIIGHAGTAKKAEDGMLFYDDFFVFLEGIVLGALSDIDINFVKKFSELNGIGKIKITKGKMDDKKFKINNNIWKDEGTVPLDTDSLYKEYIENISRQIGIDLVSIYKNK